MRRRRFIGILVLIAVGLGVWYFGFYQNRQPKSDLGVVTLYGNVDIRQVDLGFQVAGRIRRLYYEEGDNVQPGSLLGALDPVPFRETLQQNAAQVGVLSANLDKLLVGTRKEEIAQLQNAVQEQAADLSNAEALLEKRSAVVTLGGVTRQDYEDALNARNATAARLKKAKNALWEGLNGPVKEDIRAARANVRAAQATLSQAKTQLGYTKLYAPSAGIIQTRVVEPGTMIAVGQTVYTLALATPKWVWAYLEEPDLGRVKPGLKVSVLTDTEPAHSYSAQVGFIAPVSEFTPKNVETSKLRTALVYPVRIVVKDPHNQLRQGMPVTVRIQTGIARPMNRANYD